MIIDRARVAAALPAYQLGRELGTGSFGLVVEARHSRLDRDVAIKILSAAHDGAHASFEAEARVLAGIDHPHVVRVYDYVEDDGGLCLIIMELLPGGTLTRRRARTSAESTCAIGLAVAEALACAHAKGVLHRDIKTDNMLFDAEGLLKVTDFGIAKIFEGTAATASAVVGTPKYMAPEQVAGGRLGPGADLYALGVILYELLAGAPPFDPKLPLLARYQQQLDGVPAPPAGAPAPVADVVMRALAADPEARHPSAHAFALDLADAAVRSFGPRWTARSGVMIRLGDEVRQAAEWLPAPATLVGGEPPVSGDGGNGGGAGRGDRLDAGTPTHVVAAVEHDQIDRSPVGGDVTADPADVTNIVVVDGVGKGSASPGVPVPSTTSSTSTPVSTPAAALASAVTVVPNVPAPPAAPRDGVEHITSPRQRPSPPWRRWMLGAAVLFVTIAATATSVAVVVGRQMDAAPAPVVTAIPTGIQAVAPPSTPTATPPPTVTPTEPPPPAPAAPPPAPGGTGPARAATLTAHTGPVRTVAFSPAGGILASGGDDKRAILWSVADPTRPTRMAALTGHTATVWSMAFSPDGRTLATGGDDKNVILWDVADAAHPARLATLPAAVWSVAFSPDGRTLATAGADNSVILWDVADRAQPARVANLAGHGDVVFGMAFSPDGRMLATTSTDATAILWDVAGPSRPARRATLTGHAGAVTSAAFSQDGRSLATGGRDNTAILWDVADPSRPARRATLTGHTQPVREVAFSPDAGTLVTGSGDNTAIVWNIADPARPARTATLAGHSNFISDVMFSPDGRSLALASWDRTVTLWRT